MTYFELKTNVYKLNLFFHGSMNSNKVWNVVFWNFCSNIDLCSGSLHCAFSKVALSRVSLSCFFICYLMIIVFRVVVLVLTVYMCGVSKLQITLLCENRWAYCSSWAIIFTLSRSTVASLWLREVPPSHKFWWCGSLHWAYS